MALLFSDDSFDLSHRLHGFDRYRQILSFQGFHWIKINFITTIGFIPFIVGCTYSILASSSLLMMPLSFLGGLIFGPFLACLYDSLLRGLRDAPGSWWNNYKKSWKQNWKGSLLPNAIFGLIIGMNIFMLYMMWVSQVFPGWGTIALYVFGILLFFTIMNLYMAQMVLFQQTTRQRIINIILFTSKYFWKVLTSAIIELIYIIVFILLAPWSILLVPLLGLWFILFLYLFRIYEPLNLSFQIEKQYISVEGDPWAKDPFEIEEDKE